MHDQAYSLPAQADRRQLCAFYAREARDVYPGRAWKEIEAHVQRAWERKSHGMTWSDAAPLVKSFWAEDAG